MLSSIYYGEIQSDKLVSWNENKDPYNILVENNRVYKLGGWEFLDIANKLFDNEKQVDWGSYAYQCTKEQLEKLMEHVVNVRFCPQLVRGFCPEVAGFNAGTYEVPAYVL